MGDLWIGYRESEFACLRYICPTLAHGGVNNWGAAFLPAHCQGTPIGNASLAATAAKVKHIRNDRIDPQLQRQQLDLLNQLNQQDIDRHGRDAALEGRLNSFELAYRMQASMPEVQDLNGESAATKKLYASTTQSLRTLVVNA